MVFEKKHAQPLDITAFDTGVVAVGLSLLTHHDGGQSQAISQSCGVHGAGGFDACDYVKLQIVFFNAASHRLNNVAPGFRMRKSLRLST